MSDTFEIAVEVPKHQWLELRHSLATADPRNTIAGGSCSDFAEYMATTGVFDASGANHPHWAGATYLQPSIGRIPTLRVTTTSATLWECPGNPGVYYDTQDACEAVDPCRPGLGGSLIKCGGVSVTCLIATVKLPLDGTITTSVLNWQPSSPSASCSPELARFNQAVQTHEQHHKNDAQKIIAKQKAAPAKQFKACAGSAAEARDALIKRIQKAETDAADTMNRTYLASVTAFHGTPAGKPQVFDCSQC